MPKLSEGHCHKAFQIIELSPELQDAILKGSVQSKARNQVIDVQTQMQSFNFFFGPQLGVLVLRHTDYSPSTMHTHLNVII